MSVFVQDQTNQTQNSTNENDERNHPWIWWIWERETRGWLHKQRLC